MSAFLNGFLNRLFILLFSILIIFSSVSSVHHGTPGHISRSDIYRGTPIVYERYKRDHSWLFSEDLLKVFGQCPPPVKHFNVQKFSHLWYMRYISNFALNRTFICMDIEVEFFSGGRQVDVTANFLHARHGKHITKEGAEIIWTPDIGEFRLHDPRSNTIEGAVNIVLTDYINYALVIQCKTEKDDLAIIAVLAKDVELQRDILQEMENFLMDYGYLDELVLIPTCKVI